MCRRQFAATIAIAASSAFLSISPLQAETHGDYREFALGGPVAQVVAQIDSSLADVVRIHEQPALIQRLRWRIPYLAAGTNEPRKDPVQQVVFDFFDDQLFKITVDYDRLRVEGMTESDMIAALSERYGLPIAPFVASNRSVLRSSESSVSSDQVAAWERGDVAVVLLRNEFLGGFQLVVRSQRLDNLARIASAEAIQLETAAAPALEVARRQREVDAARDAKEKARAANKALFQP